MITKIKHKNLTWIDIKSPREKDIKYLRNKFSFIHELVLEEIRLKKENHDNIRDFIESQNYDREWEAYLASSSYDLALCSVKMTIARGKMIQIRKNLKLDN